MANSTENTIRVLHIDDDSSFLRITQLMLKTLENNLTIDTATSVDEAFQKLLNNYKYDVIISDYDMPIKNGLDFLKELQDKNIDIPFILFTGKGREEIAIQALNLGANGYYNKQGNPETVFGELAHGIINVAENKQAKLELQKTHKRFQEAQSIAHVGNWEIDLQTKTMWASDEAFRIYGLKLTSDNTLPLTQAQSAVSPEDRHKLDNALEALIRNNTPYEVEFSINRVNDKEKRIVYSKANLLYKGNSPIKVVGVLFDITERKKAEEIATLAQDRFTQMAQNSKDIIMLTKTDGRIVYLSPACKTVLGYEPNELMGSYSPWIIHPDDSERIQEIFKNALRNNFSGEEEYRIITANNEIKFINHVYSQIEISNEREIVSIIKDISQRKKAEQALLESNKRYEMLFRAIAGGVVVQNPIGEIIEANPTACAILGLSKDELSGRTSVDPRWLAIHEDGTAFSGEKHPAMVTLRTGKPVKDVVMGVLNPQLDSYRWIIVNSEPMFDMHGELKSVATTFIDITERKKVEETLKESEIVFSKVFHDTPVPMAIVALPKSNLVEVNDSLLKVIGFDRDELIGHNVVDIGIIKSDEEQKARVQNILKDGSMHNREIIIYTKNKTPMSVIMSSTVVNINGKDHVVSQFIDITDRKKIEEELKQASLTMKLIFDSVNDGYWEWNIVTGKTMCSTSYYTMLGYQPNEFSFDFQTMTNSIMHPDSAKLVKQTIEECIITKKPFTIEIKLKNKKGDYIWALSRGKIVEWDDEGKPTRMVGTHTDITEKKIIQLKLAESEENYRSVVTALDEGIVMQDQTGTIIAGNSSAQRILGLTYDQMMGRTSVDPQWGSIHEDGSPFPGETHPAMYTLKTGKPQKNIVMGVNKPDDSLTWISINSQPIYKPDNRDKPTAVVTTFLDVTQRKKYEQELRDCKERITQINNKLRIVSSLTRHDIRNKLSAINCLTYLIRKQYPTDLELLGKVSEIEQAVYSCEGIFEFTKNYEKVRAEHLVNVDVSSMIEDVRFLFPKLPFKLINDCSGLTLEADSLLRQLFYNFVENTKKYGRQTKFARIYYEKSDDGCLRLIYEDDGKGISLDNKSKIFTKGFSTGNSTGLGLFLVKKIVEAYGWTIKEEGQPGKGAKFVIEIPKTVEK